MQALELKTRADENGAVQIQLSKRFKNQRFKVILLSVDEDEEWLNSLEKNPAFDFLKDEKEDIYSINDGNAISD